MKPKFAINQRVLVINAIGRSVATIVDVISTYDGSLLSGADYNAGYFESLKDQLREGYIEGGHKHYYIIEPMPHVGSIDYFYSESELSELNRVTEAIYG